MSVRQLVVKAWNAISHFDTLTGLFGWVGGSCLGSVVAGRLAIMEPGGWLQNPFIPMAWFFGVIFVTVLAAKSIGFAWPKWNQYRRSKAALRNGHADTAPANSEIQKLRGELRACKKDRGEAELRRFANLVKMNIERIRAEGRSLKDIRVTVRFADYKDLDLAREIKTIIENCMQWPVEIDGSNKPTIMPDKAFKVLFDVGRWGTSTKWLGHLVTVN